MGELLALIATAFILIYKIYFFMTYLLGIIDHFILLWFDYFNRWFI